ncbi:MFS transporter [Amycolatopsis sacchari]|uniref:Glycoside/pentoside/hexuronide:cation symporter, GPH family n=1 Tax=Amycolatopsis sacchari TaxID=115433 RepID=A0A1I3UN72_9PSEU|nr:glycoside-pentoside-hexuronide (GPH):cation symporter [Amycolatopsis sacchari]SFJ84103.1 glycoside/pentoside/hexuronide:cation symporter, GPH family [Amycolatopsis sacchari]
MSGRQNSPVHDPATADGGPPGRPLDPADDPRAVRHRERAAFALGDIASNLVWTTISSYLLFFYTDVALIGAAAAGTLMLVARLLDAVFDPVVGLLLDRTSTRWGRARPYLLFGAPLLGGLTFLTFLTPGGGGGLTVAYAAVTFVLVGFAYSLVNVPYGAAMAMTTRDSGTRMSLAGFRTFGVGLGIIVVSSLTQPLVRAIGGTEQSRSGFAWTIGGYAVVSTLLIWVVFALVRERVPLTPSARERGSTAASLKTLLRNKPWLSVFGFSILSFARLGVVTGGAVYFAIHALGDPGAIPVILLAFSLSAVVGSLLTARVLRLLGQRRGIVLGLALSVVLSVPLLFLRHDLVAFCLVFFVLNVVGGFGFVAAPALTADTAEWQEWRSGRRNEGLLFAGYSMSTKIGAALGSALLAWGLAAISYDPAAVTPAVSDDVVWLFIGLPAVIGLLQIAAIAPYDLERRLPSLRADLAARAETGGPAGSL